MTLAEATLRAAHRRSIRHRKEIEASDLCSCFYCKEAFAPADIVRWIREEETALCPRCGIDSVLGNTSGYPISDPEFLNAMHQFWFERTVHVEN